MLIDAIGKSIPWEHYNVSGAESLSIQLWFYLDSADLEVRCGPQPPHPLTIPQRHTFFAFHSLLTYSLRTTYSREGKDLLTFMSLFFSHKQHDKMRCWQYLLLNVSFFLCVYLEYSYTFIFLAKHKLHGIKAFNM